MRFSPNTKQLRRGRRSAWIAAAALIAAPAAPATAADGDLDGTFGSGGIALTSVMSANVSVNAAVREPGGATVVAGAAATALGSELLVARLDRQGNLDPSFNPAGGQPGVLRIALGSGADARATAIVRTADGYLVAGHAQDAGQTKFALVAVRDGGEIDGAVGGAGSPPGTVLTAVGDGANATAAGIVRLDDGSVIVAGTARDAGVNKLALVKYSAAGGPVAGFGSAGVVLRAVDGSPDTQGFAIVRGRPGSVIVAGSATVSGRTRMLAASFRQSIGTPELDFGRDGPGLTLIDLGNGVSQAFAITSSADQRWFYLAGSARVAGDQQRLAVARINASGAPDPNFSNTVDLAEPGLLLAIGSDGVAGASSALVTINDAIVVTGFALDGGGTRKMVALRLHRDGRLDASFAAGSPQRGVKLLAVGSDGNTYATALVPQPDADILVAGSSADGGVGKLMLTRLEGGDAHRPTVTITAPAQDSFHPRLPLTVEGSFRADLGVAGLCVAAPSPDQPMPARCEGFAGQTGGTFTLPVADARPGANTIHVFLRDLAGNVARAAVRVDVATPGQIDLRVKSIEVTQGTQLVGSLQFPGSERTTTYRGVRLAADRKTIVRVYANAARTPRPDLVTRNVPLVLYGYKRDNNIGPEVRLPGLDGRPGSPLLPQSGTASLGLGSPFVTMAERVDPSGAYTFTLPAGWVAGSGRNQRLRLVAEVNPTELAPSVPEAPGDRANNRLTLENVYLTAMRRVVVSPVAMFHTETDTRVNPPVTRRVDPPAPAMVFARARDMIPTADDGLIVRPYLHWMDITGVEARRVAERARLVDEGVPPADSRFQDANNRATDRSWSLMTEWERGHDEPGLPIGIFSLAYRGTASLVFFAEQGRADQIAVAPAWWPINQVTHELTHSMRIRHTAGCGADNADDWPPDQEGRLQGIGLDPVPSPELWRGRFRILAPRESMSNPQLYAGQQLQYYDYMSYCTGNDESKAWVSPRTWNSLIDGLKIGGGLPDYFGVPWNEQRAPGTFTPRAAQSPRQALRVAVLLGSGDALHSMQVSPHRGALTKSDPASPYQIVVRDSAGDELSATPIAVTHPDDAPAGSLTSLTAYVPGGDTAAAVEVLHDGRTVARRARSAQAPVVRMLSPRKGARLGPTGYTKVRWSARDADGDPLRAWLDLSVDDGRTWRPLTAGITATHEAIPNAYLTGSRTARLRVTVNDGFRESAAVSARFAAAGRPPEARILHPQKQLTIAGDAPLYLSGQAIDDYGAPLPARALRWRDGRRTLGRGARLDVRGLAPGRHAIRLIARDRSGRSGSDVVVVRVAATAPQFVGLRAPARISRRTRRVRLRVGSTVDAVLTVGGRRFKVGPRPRRLSLAVRPGRSPLRLLLALRAGRAGASTTVRIARR